VGVLAALEQAAVGGRDLAERRPLAADLDLVRRLVHELAHRGDAPQAIDASTRFAEPSRRTRSFSAHAERNITRQGGEGMWVARFTTTS